MLRSLPGARRILWEEQVVGWQEIPKGGINRGPGAIKKIWYNPAVRLAAPRTLSPAPRALSTSGFDRDAPLRAWQIIPLWGAIGLASVVCGGFMVKYFGGHTEISWSKTMRATYDHRHLHQV